MPSFAESFIRGHARGTMEAERRRKQDLDEQQFEEQKKQNAEAIARHKQQMEVDKAISTLNFQLKAQDLMRETARPTTTAAAKGFPEQSPEMGGPSPRDISVPADVPPTIFDLSALGGGKIAVKPMFAEDVAQKRLESEKATAEARSQVELSTYEKKKKIDEANEGFTLSRDILGFKKGQRVNPQELSAAAAVFTSQEATTRALEEARIRTHGMSDPEQAQYLAEQVSQRRLDYRSLGKEQKPLVAAALAATGNEIPRPLSAKEREAGNNAVSGLAALDRMDALLAKDPHLPLKEVGNLPGIFGAPMRAANPEVGEFGAAKREVVDVITRLRTGAALNKQEEGFYPRQVVEIGDSEQTIARKHNHLRAFYLGMTGVPVKLTSPDGTKQKTAQDMFDPKQRLGVRKLIDAGWSLEY